MSKPRLQKHQKLFHTPVLIYLDTIPPKLPTHIKWRYLFHSSYAYQKNPITTIKKTPIKNLVYFDWNMLCCIYRNVIKRSVNANTGVDVIDGPFNRVYFDYWMKNFFLLQALLLVCVTQVYKPKSFYRWCLRWKRKKYAICWLKPLSETNILLYYFPVTSL